MPREDLVRDLTLVVLYLNSWVEGVYRLENGETVEGRCAWKSADWDALDALRDADYVRCSNKAKSAGITPAGIERAEQLIEEMGLSRYLTENE